MAKYGPHQVGFLLVGGFSLLGADVTEVSGPDQEALLEETTGLGAAYPTHAGTGLRKGTFGHQGFYDDTTGSVNEALLTGSQQVAHVVCLGPFGNTIGLKFWGLAGAIAGKYSRPVKRGELHKGVGDYTVTGAVEEGVILQHVTAKTVDWNTEGAESVDNGASSANGGAGYQQVPAFTGFTGFVGKIRHSADDVTYADLITFTNVTLINNAQRITAAGTVNRHLAYDGNVTGSGSIQVMAGFARG